MSKRVLITGITGMAGSHLADYLLAEHPQYEIFGTKRWRSPVANILHLKDRVQFVDCDLTDHTAALELMRKVKPDFIFHLAGHSFVPDSWRNPFVTLSDNAAMQLNVFEAVRHCDISPTIQVALSSEEYGKVYSDELPINELNQLRPLSPYAVSKVTQDMLAYQYHQSYGLKVIRTRAFNHEGPRRGEVFVTSNFAKQIAEIELGLREPVIKVGNLDAERDWTDVRDVVRAYWMAVNKCTPGETYVIASGKSRSIRSLLDLLLKMTDHKIEVEIDPARLRPSDVERLVGDATKFKQATGWEPQISFEQTMSDLLNDWRQRLRGAANERLTQVAAKTF